MTANSNRPPAYGFVNGQLVIYNNGDIVAVFPKSYIAHMALALVKELRRDYLE